METFCSGILELPLNLKGSLICVFSPRSGLQVFGQWPTAVPSATTGLRAWEALCRSCSSLETLLGWLPGTIYNVINLLQKQTSDWMNQRWVAVLPSFSEGNNPSESALKSGGKNPPYMSQFSPFASDHKKKPLTICFLL